MKIYLLAGALTWGIALAPTATQAGGLAKSLTRGATRSVTRAAPRSLRQTLRRDLTRDRATLLRPLPRSRTVFRYTTKDQAKQELRKGIRPERHMTSRALPGRPLSAGKAQRRYRLPRRPEARETIWLPRGLPVRHNRALGGARGVGEITTSRRLPPEAIRRVTPLRQVARSAHICKLYAS